MKISFWKRLAIYFVLSIIVMVLMSLFAQDSDARASVQAPAGDANAGLVYAVTPPEYRYVSTWH